MNRVFITIGILLCQQILECEAAPRNIYPRGGSSLMQYRDVIQILKKSEIKRRVSGLTSNEDLNLYSENSDGYFFSRNRLQYDDETQSSNEHRDNNRSYDRNKRGQAVIYRYFNRSRARSVRSDSIPFIVIGSCVDHWKLVGRILASRGFNCIVVERVKETSKSKAAASKSSSNYDTFNEGEALVTSILDALKWQRAILVGCDSESVIGLEAALRLAPDRVVGLVLCGDLSSFYDHIESQITTMRSYHSDGDDADSINIESFLKHYVECPCQLVWDGDNTSWPLTSHHASDSLSSSSISKIILGGGCAPHRRLPEQFAWTLTRFVEEKVSAVPPPITEKFPISIENDSMDLDAVALTQKYHHRTWNLPQIFAPGTLLVAGRILATTIIYLSIAKVMVVQYRNFRLIQSSCLNLSKLQIMKNVVNSLRKIELSRLFALYIPKAVESHADDVTQESINNEQNEITTETDDDKAYKDLESVPETQPNAEPQQQHDDKDTNSEEDSKSDDKTSPLFQKLLFFDQIIS